ncbi:oxygenase MpaB family protein, partial [Nocardia gipuzkoensis]
MNPTIPRRHPASPRKVPGLRPFALLMGIGAPSPRQWDALGEALLVGDEPMDRLVEWMYAEGAQRTRPLFERALAEGIAAVPEAPEPLREFFARYETPPDWVDWDKIRRAERVFRMGGTDGLYIARDVSLLGGYLASGFNKTLVRTGALEKGPAKRFAETLQWALDVTSDDGMLPGGLGYRSTIRVRLI